MNNSSNFVHHQLLRELDEKHSPALTSKFTVTANLIKRLGLYGELQGHTGCVNCLEWSRDGRLLASGSDDACLNLYDPMRKKLLTTIPTGHQGNIFSVNFSPDPSQIISCSADHSIRVQNIESKDTLLVCNCHVARVKRLASDLSSGLVFSAGEDGLILQHDFRLAHSCDKKEILIDLKEYTGGKSEAKCIALNPTRPEYLAVGCNDQYARLYDRRMIVENKVNGAVQYFVPGHLSCKTAHKKRSLAATYVTFNEDGSDLLVNLGGEQIYLFSLGGGAEDYRTFAVPDTANDKDKEAKEVQNGHKNGHVPGSDNIHPEELFGKYTEKVALPDYVEGIKMKANDAFQLKNYSLAISLYNEAIFIYKHSAVLYGNRGAALLKREWDGDVFEALRDCQSALTIDPDHYKAHLRLCRCYLQLALYEECQQCLASFKSRFPAFSSTPACKSVEEDLQKAQKKKSSTSESEPKTKVEMHLRFSSSSSTSDSSFDSFDASTSPATPPSPSPAATPTPSPTHATLEAQLQSSAQSHSQRFAGHCNTTTDIKEANFFGPYIVAGSDDGSFFIWDRANTNIVKVMKGDESIVNCLQPHPNNYCMLATSGIENVVRLWAPVEELEPNPRLIADFDNAASLNQKRMKSNPFELILMNLGYHLGSENWEDESPDLDSPNLRCNPT